MTVGNSRLIYSKYSTNLYRPGNLNMPVRMRNILSMSPQPDLVEIITWVYLLFDSVIMAPTDNPPTE